MKIQKTLIRFGCGLAAAGIVGSAPALADTIQVTAPISGKITWFKTNEYVLNKFVYVLDGGELRIEPGTVVKGKPGTDANTSALIVTRGGRIFAEGTASEPIIFTAEADDVTDPFDLGIYQRGLWGGVVLLGKATVNTALDAGGNAASPKYDVFEGLPDALISANGQNVHRFGGGDDNDSSGVMRYVSIRHAGVVFQPNKELNGLSLGGVGRGTTLEYIETYATADDGFEFFGGTVNTRYLVSAFNDDDAFDTDQGWSGKNQFWFSIQEPGRKDNGGEWNGEPNGAAANNPPIANFEVYNATFIGAGTNSAGNRGLTIREYAAPKLYNSILTEFGGNAMTIDDKSRTHLDAGVLDIRDNIFWKFTTNGVAVALHGNANSETIFTNTARANLNIDPMLRGISRTNIGTLDPRPAKGSPALSTTRIPPSNGFYSPVTYKGAFGSSSLWIQGWTHLAERGFTPEPEAGPDIVEVTAPVTGKTTWYSTNEYVLNKFIYVLEGAELRIEPGTVIKAAPGTDANTSALIVTRGGKIFAEGTPSKPIIFTALADDVNDPDDLGNFQRGLWGGVVILGRAGINTALDSAGNAANPKFDVFEGLPDASVSGQNVHRFGGADDNDNSGVLRYVSIRHAGVVFQPNKELNGLSLGGVGRGTTIEFVETYATADDGFEFFGGTVNTRHLVSAFNDDDGFDTDQGWRGKNQFWFLIQEPGRKDSGGEWNGEPNGAAANNAPIGNFEVYNATFIGAGTNTAGNRGLTIREYAAPKLYNSVFTGFGGNAMTIDDKSKAHLDSGVLDIRDNIFWNFATNGIAVALAGNANAQPVFTDASRNNLNVNPMLLSISRSNDGTLDPRPASGSPALSGARPTPADGFYTPVDYKGAFGPGELWIDGWTYLSQKGFVPQRGANIVNVTAPISGKVSWHRTNEYILEKFIYVLDGAELHIEAGTVIKSKPGTDASTTALIVTRGGRIFAEGTPTQPIIFTALADDVNDPDDLDIYQRGLWGGVVLLGKAGINTALDAAGNAATPKHDVFEGLPDAVVANQNVHRFGGGDDNDSSGILRYVSIRHAGVVFQPNKELNGLSLGGVGRGTKIEFVETYATADDGFEFFGGTVNTSHLISAFNDDDGFDTDQGWRGKNQFWFLIQEPGRKDSGGEWNGEPNGAAANNPPVGNFEIHNATFIGAGTRSAGNRGLTIREYAAPKLYNSIFTEFGGNAMTIDDKSKVHLEAGLIDIRDNLFWNFGTNGVEVQLAGNANSLVIFNDASRNNINANPMLMGVSRTDNGGLDPRPAPGSPALATNRKPAADGFFIPVDYKGAFGARNWAVDWSFLSAKGILSAAGGGNPVAVASVVVTAPELTVLLNAGTVQITFPSKTGVTYKLQSAATLNTPAAWSDVGAPMTGNGGILSTTEQVAQGSSRFYRVIAQ